MEPTTTQLQELKAVETDMLRYFVSVCQRLHLRYYLLGGTLLGAVRHQGFIPWDDDIDVGMPRKDYEIFLKEAPALLPAHLFVQSIATEKEYLMCFAKIRNSNTTFLETDVNHLDINRGIFIDIFPLDYCPKDSRKRRIILKKNQTYTRTLAMFFNFTGKSAIANLQAWAVRTFLPLIRRIARKREDLHRSVSPSGLIANYGGAWGEKEIVPADWYGEGVTLVFEGMEVTAPVEYHQWLTQVYGDYMQLPPIEKRVTHHNTDVIDVHKPYTEYVRKKK